eukprot:m.430429 g.430429  ORF g.430429 m.430429 type:complete len:222 (-) comp56727_c0_seq6:1133-1798(-)
MSIYFRKINSKIYDSFSEARKAARSASPPPSPPPTVGSFLRGATQAQPREPSARLKKGRVPEYSARILEELRAEILASAAPTFPRHSSDETSPRRARARKSSESETEEEDDSDAAEEVPSHHRSDARLRGVANLADDLDAWHPGMEVPLPDLLQALPVTEETDRQLPSANHVLVEEGEHDDILMHLNPFNEPEKERFGPYTASESMNVHELANPLNFDASQ